jgi:hypothetical protein
MHQILIDLAAGACIVGTLADALAKLDRLWLGRKAIDKASTKQLPAVVGALAKWSTHERSKNK